MMMHPHPIAVSYPRCDFRDDDLPSTYARVLERLQKPDIP
jgi:hypothetical protein